MRFSLLFLVALLVSLPGRSFAQHPDVGPTLQASLLQNWYLRATLTDSVVFLGRVHSLTADSVRVDRTTLALDRIVQLDRRTREGGRALTGGVVGGIALGGFLFVIIADFCEFSCGRDIALGLGSGLVLGGALGALLGEAISPAKQRWHQVWPVCTSCGP